MGVGAGVLKKGEGWVQTLKRRPLGPPLGPRLGLGGGSKGFGAGGVGGRGTGPGTEQISQFHQKIFLKGSL